MHLIIKVPYIIAWLKRKENKMKSFKMQYVEKLNYANGEHYALESDFKWVTVKCKDSFTANKIFNRDYKGCVLMWIDEVR